MCKEGEECARSPTIYEICKERAQSEELKKPQKTPEKDVIECYANENAKEYAKEN